MELKGSKTEQNLWTAFAGESQARNKYDYYASDVFVKCVAVINDCGEMKIEKFKM